MLAQRVITAVVLLLILAGAAVLGPAAVLALGAVILGLACFEWLRLAGLASPWSMMLGIVFAVLALSGAWFGSLTAAAATWILVGAAAAWLGIAALLFRHEADGARLPRWLIVSACPLLLAAAWLGFVRLLAHGYLYLLSALALVWIADIAAYFAGRAFGRRKLAPRISPGKTWAGVGGAMAAVLLIAIALYLSAPAQNLLPTRLAQASGMAAMLAIMAVLVALSIAGDLFESLLKRQAGVKDSSALLPGHGGVFDRIDALLPVLPLAALVSGGLP
ncbi:MAG TPA: phosphatidate cytidylyltransferase [Burkholderiaceae bacterium]|jgi:phosphatidate cytidylyltransferase|nr:phosphatidate cytidylyltransferase [Burkholderiaceae bacterium]